MAHIIIVDDEPHLVMIMSKLLEAKQHKITGISESDAAEQLLKNNDYDLMITDVRMNPINGMELLKQARRERPKMPVIMITAYHSPELSRHAKRQGAYAYFPKPFELTEVFEAIEEALSA